MNAENVTDDVVLVDDLPGGRFCYHHADGKLLDYQLNAALLKSKLAKHGLMLGLGRLTLGDVARDGLDRRATPVHDDGGRAFHEPLLAVQAPDAELKQRDFLPVLHRHDLLGHRLPVVRMNQLVQRVTAQRIEILRTEDTERGAVRVEKVAAAVHQYRVRGHLHQGTVVPLAFPQEALHLGALGVFAGDDGDAGQISAAIEDRGESEGHGDFTSPFGQAHRLQVADAFAAQDLLGDLAQFVTPAVRDEEGYIASDRLFGAVAVERFRGMIPTGDDPFTALAQNRVIGGVDNGGEMSHGLFVTCRLDCARFPCHDASQGAHPCLR